MDKLKVKARTARNRVAEGTSRGTGSASLSVPHSTLPPQDDASITGVNEGFIGPQPGTSARDFAASADEPAHQPLIEPPTSLQSSVDAGIPVPTPRNNGRPPKATSRYHRMKYPFHERALLILYRSGRPRGNSASNSRPPLPPPAQQTRPSAIRQSSIGIRRMPSSGPLPPVALNPNASTNALQQTSSRLPALEEEVQLEPVATKASSSTASSTPRTEPSRLKKVSSAVQARLGFGKDKNKAKEQDVEAGVDALPPGAPDQGWQYSSNMVDVLDTVGMYAMPTNVHRH
jgi:hypothetical protein